MNKRTVVNNLGKIIMVEAVLMVIPLILCLCYGEFVDAHRFAVTILPTAIIGLLCTHVKGSSLNPRDGYVIVASA